VRADLARLFVRHKAKMGLADASDRRVILSVDSIAAALIGLTMRARERGDDDWLDRHRWWLKAATRLWHGETATTLDG